MQTHVRGQQTTVAATWQQTCSCHPNELRALNCTPSGRLLIVCTCSWQTCCRPAPTSTTVLQIQDLGSGSFGCCKLAIDKADGEKVAVKFIPRGPRVRIRLHVSTMAHGLPQSQHMSHDWRKLHMRSNEAHLSLACAYQTQAQTEGHCTCAQIDRNVEREVLIHSQLNHPCIVGFKKVRLHCTCLILPP